MFRRIFMPVISIIVSLMYISCGGAGDQAATTPAAVKDTTPPFDEAAMRAAIAPGLHAFATAVMSGDSAGVVNMYAPDARLMAPNAPALTGRAAIGGLVSGILKMGIKEFSDSSTAVYGNKDNIIEEGAYTMKDAKGKVMDKGKYVEVWRQIDGQWKMVVDIFNSDMPAPKAK